jgi:hypothetical protein
MRRNSEYQPTGETTPHPDLKFKAGDTVYLASPAMLEDRKMAYDQAVIRSLDSDGLALYWMEGTKYSMWEPKYVFATAAEAHEAAQGFALLLIEQTKKANKRRIQEIKSMVGP